MKDKILGCLIGGAAGDALGYAVEFSLYSSIVKQYGSEGIRRYELNSDGLAEVSDDTQMTLYTANGLLIGDITTAYIEWLNTQYSHPGTLKDAKCWLSNVPEMYAARAPGNTCLSALRAIAAGVEANNNSKGCGGIMRVAPIALFNAVRGIDAAETAQQACEVACITHKHPLGWIPAGVVAYIIQKIIENKPETAEGMRIKAEEGAKIIADKYPEHQKYCDEVSDWIEKAYQLSQQQGVDDEPQIRRLGEGWVGDEALYIALYCSMKYIGDFEKALVASVNHSGDSDSTGAITGNIMGALLGYAAIPQYYKDNLELTDVIKRIADELCQADIFK